MKKVLVVLMVLGLMNVCHARQRAESWNVYNTVLSANLITAPYLNSGLYVQGIGTSVNVYLLRSGTTSTNYITIQPNTGMDFYPINVVSGKTVLLQAVTSGSVVQYIWYTNKE